MTPRPDVGDSPRQGTRRSPLDTGSSDVANIRPDCGVSPKYASSPWVPRAERGSGLGKQFGFEPFPWFPSILPITVELLGEHGAELIFFFFLIGLPDPLWELLGVHFKVREREEKQEPADSRFDCMLNLVWCFPHLAHLFYGSWNLMNDRSGYPASVIRGSGQKHDLITRPPTLCPV